MTDGYLRYPDVHDDQVVFVAADDVWLTSTDGGRASRLTSDHVPVSRPRLSPDGTTVAWTSARDGAPEAYVLDLTSGRSQRLTYLGAASTFVLGWTPDGRVLVASSAGEPNGQTTARAVTLDGVATPLPYGPVSAVALHPSGAVAIATPFSRPPALWKRYRGGNASRLWIDPTGSGDWRRLLPTEQAALDGPCWVGNRLVFDSDLAARLPGAADGQADLYAIDALAGENELAGVSEPVRLTRHTEAEGYVRDPRSDGNRVVFHALGRLYVLDSLDTAPRRLDVRLSGALPTRQPRPAVASENLDVIAPDHAGDASLVGWRGTVQHLTHRAGPVRTLAADSAVRHREPTLLGRSGRAAWISDAEGPDRIEIGALAAATPVRVISGDFGRVLHLAADPAGQRLAALSHDGRVRVVEFAPDAASTTDDSIAEPTVRELAHSVDGEPHSPVFSPDGRYLVWVQPAEATGHEQLMVADLIGDTTAGGGVALTAGRFADAAPGFTRDGKFLALLSRRTFDPTYDAHGFDLSFTAATRPYLVPLGATEPAPFGPSVDGWPVGDGKGPEKTTGGADAPSGGDEPPAVTLDLEGFEDRIVAFPVPAGSYTALQPAKDGVVWIHQAADQGAIGSGHAGLDAPVDVVEFFSFTKRALEVVADKADTVAVTGDGARMVVRAGDEVSVQPVDSKPAPDADSRVRVDLGRLRFTIDPAAEWLQMFDETTRVMAHQFWRADMDGVDWDAVIARYRPIVERVGSRDDLVDLLWEVVGELNTSHAYVRGGSDPDPHRRLGLLGADLAPDAEGWRIVRTLPGESSDPDARSPLRAAGVGARPGDVIVAVGGVPVDPLLGPAGGLVGAADQPVELTIRPPGTTGEADRRVAVVPLADESALRYQDWVRSRDAYVTEHSGGRLGYVHIPDMMGPGWAQLHRDLHRATLAEGLIVDVRYNRGGHTSQLVIERLARRVVGWNHARDIERDTSYPEAAVRGPVVFITNEYAGSDGDIICAAAQELGVGPVVGMRSWGGVVGIDGRYELVDGTAITQPRYAFWFTRHGWGVENHGVDPDIEVPHTPGDYDGAYHGTGVDPQLDRAIVEALDRLATTPAATPPPLPEPKVRRG